ncbi:cytochrome p450 [Colletotrichum kahawae]|uniref:Cytochrome p450 n=1 Tax=Colletotrichum kahawae TaxID=34407 RepID=A0AAD9Y6C2_COLKA|nr:cytochrome p450 [Colletotrichum kahawae]
MHELYGEQHRRRQVVAATKCLGLTIGGPIIRINPDEVHCSDPDFINTLYASGGKRRNKSSLFVVGFPSDEYCFGEPFGFLHQPGWDPNFREAIYAMFHLIHIMRHFLSVINEVSENAGALAYHSKAAAYDAGVQMSQNTVLFSLLSSNLPAEEKTTERLSGEANVFLAVGMETIAIALSLCIYYLLKNMEIVAKMRAELLVVVMNLEALLNWFVLERLPHLTAVIKETL